LRPGSCLNVVIRYKARCEPPKCCHLVIASDDPSTPIRTLDVSARTCCLTCEPCNPCCCGCCGCSRKAEGRKGRCCECCDCKRRRDHLPKREPEGPIAPG
jgi:hypothetical protein